jgi:hypothetical protein
MSTVTLILQSLRLLLLVLALGLCMIAHRIDTCCTTCAPHEQCYGKGIRQVGVEADEESISGHKDDMESHELELDATVKEESGLHPAALNLSSETSMPQRHP